METSVRQPVGASHASALGLTAAKLKLGETVDDVGPGTWNGTPAVVSILGGISASAFSGAVTWYATPNSDDLSMQGCAITDLSVNNSGWSCYDINIAGNTVPCHLTINDGGTASGGAWIFSGSMVGSNASNGGSLSFGESANGISNLHIDFDGCFLSLVEEKALVSRVITGATNGSLTGGSVILTGANNAQPDTALWADIDTLMGSGLQYLVSLDWTHP